MCFNIFKDKPKYWEVFYITKSWGDGYYRLEANDEFEAEEKVKARNPDISYIRYVKQLSSLSINDNNRI